MKVQEVYEFSQATKFSDNTVLSCNYHIDVLAVVVQKSVLNQPQSFNFNS